MNEPLSTPLPTLSIALVAASPLVRAGLRAGLAEHGGFELTAVLSSWPAGGDAGFASAQVVVAEADAWPAAQEAEQGPACVLLANDRDSVQWLSEALAQGCSVLPDDAPIASIAAALHAAATGLVSSSRALLVATLRRSPGALRTSEPLEPLTPREREVLRHLSQGLGNKAIGESLNISPHTAKFHVGQIIAKLDAGSRAGAVAKAVRAGLVEI